MGVVNLVGFALMRWLLVALASLLLACRVEQPVASDLATELARLRSAGMARRVAARRVDQLARESSDRAALLEAVAGLERLYRREQRLIAAFLTRALNQEPGRSETAAALDLYRDNAVDLATYRVRHGGDRHEVLGILQQVESYYRRLGLPVPADLAEMVTTLKAETTTRPTPVS